MTHFSTPKAAVWNSHVRRVQHSKTSLAIFLGAAFAREKYIKNERPIEYLFLNPHVDSRHSKVAQKSISSKPPSAISSVWTPQPLTHRASQRRPCVCVHVRSKTRYIWIRGLCWYFASSSRLDTFYSKKSKFKSWCFLFCWSLQNFGKSHAWLCFSSAARCCSVCLCAGSRETRIRPCMLGVDGFWDNIAFFCVRKYTSNPRMCLVSCWIETCSFHLWSK